MAGAILPKKGPVNAEKVEKKEKRGQTDGPAEKAECRKDKKRLKIFFKKLVL